MALGFVDGIRIFSRAFARTWIEPELRMWYFKTLALTFVISITIIFGIFSAGTYFFATYFERPEVAGFAVLLWALMIFYLSGQLAALLVSVLVLVVGGESATTRFYFKTLTTEPSEEVRKNIRLKFSDRSRELLSMLRSFGIACIAWPLLLFPLTMPLGAVVFALALSDDSLALNRRLCHSGGYEALQDSEPVSRGARIGLGILPSSLALFPVLGWILLPILQIAGLEMQLLKQIHSKEA